MKSNLRLVEKTEYYPNECPIQYELAADILFSLMKLANFVPTILAFEAAMGYLDNGPIAPAAQSTNITLTSLYISISIHQISFR